MATEGDRGVSPFPHPPAQFYKQYTDENVKAGKVPSPPQPAKGVYFMFGAKFDTEDAILRPLKEQKIKQLYPDIHDRKSELKKLNRSINVCFLELLDILITNPASPARNQKISDLSILFINMHHLINEFRPHQARETLKVIMERQKKQREDLINQIQRDMDEAGSILKECEGLITQATSTIPRSMKVAGVGRAPAGSVGGADGEGKTGQETSSDDRDSSKVGGVNKAWKLVDSQNAELCNLIDSLLIPNT